MSPAWPTVVCASRITTASAAQATLGKATRALQSIAPRDTSAQDLTLTATLTPPFVSARIALNGCCCYLKQCLWVGVQFCQ